MSGSNPARSKKWNASTAANPSSPSRRAARSVQLASRRGPIIFRNTQCEQRQTQEGISLLCLSGKDGSGSARLCSRFLRIASDDRLERRGRVDRRGRPAHRQTPASRQIGRCWRFRVKGMGWRRVRRNKARFLRFFANQRVITGTPWR